MNEALLKEIVAKHFGKEAFLAVKGLQAFAQDIASAARVCTIDEMRESGMIEERPPMDGVRLHIAAQVLAGLVGNGGQNETVCSQLALSMADSLLFAHRETLHHFEDRYARAN